MRAEIAKTIAASETVQFYWNLLSSELEDLEEGKELLYMIIDLWITICGFSFAESVLEQYKQLHSLHTSKAKALRKAIS